jgi:hypothetical protein
MFRSATDHHQGAHLFLVKITELKMWVFIRDDVVMRQHNIQCIYVVSGVVGHACLAPPDTTYKQNMLCCCITT